MAASEVAEGLSANTTAAYSNMSLGAAVSSMVHRDSACDAW